MNTQPMYLDGVLTAREVMATNDSARLMWRMVWRSMRHCGGMERADALLLAHHTTRVAMRARLLACAYSAVWLSSWERMSLSGDVR
jgi:hypothetical protein